MRPSEIPLRDRSGKTVAHALVDGEDFVRLSRYCWHLSSDGYARRTVAGSRKVYLHREILGLDRGDRRFGDHINRNRLDCRRGNLRIVTRAQQQQNVTPRRGGSSRHRGVYFRRDTGKWVAQGGVGRKLYSLGCFDSEEEAAAVALAWRREHLPHATC